MKKLKFIGFKEVIEMRNTCILLLLLVCFSMKLSAQQANKPIDVYKKEGVSVKAYNFKTFEHYLHIQNDTTYVINFWATWCKPCVAELPNFEKLNTQYKGQKVKVILVSLDMKKQVEKSLLPFIKRKNLQSEVVFLNDPDADSWIGKVDKNWSGAIPATVIYNKVNRKFYEQSFTFEALEKELKQFIN